MSNPPLIIHSIEQLLAQAQAMKCESDDRLHDLEHTLREHNNCKAADVFLQIRAWIKHSITDIEQRTKTMTLPVIPPWDAQWSCAEPADCACMEQAHYLMSPQQALKLTLYNEQRFSVFFDHQSQHGATPTIRQTAEELLTQDKKLMAQIQALQDNFDPDDNYEQDDFDPPNIPE
jgi:hypothetical protein